MQEVSAPTPWHFSFENSSYNTFFIPNNHKQHKIGDGQIALPAFQKPNDNPAKLQRFSGEKYKFACIKTKIRFLRSSKKYNSAEKFRDICSLKL
jgi:hypothetical protein